MNSKNLIEKSLLARRKGVIHLIVFLILEVVVKIGGIFFLIFLIGYFLFDYKATQTAGVGESIAQSAIFSFMFGLVPALVGGICTEIMYRRNK